MNPQTSALEVKCKCDPKSWAGKPNEICAEFNPVYTDEICDTCMHDKACHAPTANQEGV